MYGYMNPFPTHISKVHGLDGAKAFPLGPSSDVLLMDDADEIVYFKMTDAGGYPTVKAYRLVEIVENPPKADALNDIYTRLEEIEKRLNHVDTGNAEQQKFTGVESVSEPTV